jgi:putative protease
VATTESLANGDGLNYMHKREVAGLQANKVQQLDTETWRVWPNERMTELAGLKVGAEINRNRDHAWEQSLTKKSSERRIGVWLKLEDEAGGLKLTATDEDGVTASASAALVLEPAQQADKAVAGLRDSLGKLGNTIFHAQHIDIATRETWFVPAGAINALRRDAIEQLEAARVAAWLRPQRKAEVQPPTAFPDDNLSYLANVYNQAARDFYHRHGVKLIAAAYEAHEEEGEVSLMITKHCLRFSYNLCPKQAKGVKGVQGQVKAEPMTLVNGNEKFTLRFDCKPCEMHVMGKAKKHILNSPPPSNVPVSTITFYKKRPV